MKRNTEWEFEYAGGLLRIADIKYHAETFTRQHSTPNDESREAANPDEDVRREATNG